MVVTLKEIAPNRYRESFGRYYEDFNVGDIYEHRPGRTITETENIWFTLLTMNTHTPSTASSANASSARLSRSL
jgi:acyl dehydratase